MRILVTGAEGLLGSVACAAARSRGHAVIPHGHTSLDVTDRGVVRRAIDLARPDAILHCAAYTAVDRAESEPDRAARVNRDGTRHVAEAADAVGARLVYVSTDYVFDGRKRMPYLPGDEAAPLSVYGRTKLEGEWAAEVATDVMIVRSSWLYGARRGFVPAVLRRARGGAPLRIVDDQRGRPTWAPHAAAAILDLLEGGVSGVWHVAGGGECTRAELAREVLGLEGLDADVETVSTEAYGASARRPLYSVLDLSATEERLGREMPDWRHGLRQFLASERRAAAVAEG